MSRLIYSMLLVCCLMWIVGCGGTREYRVKQLATLETNSKLPGNATLDVSMEEIYNHELGFYTYKLHVREGVEKQYQKMLKELFAGDKEDDVHLAITTLDTSIFPIAGLIIDVRLFFRVEIFRGKKREKQKTLMIYGFGSDRDGNRALGQAVANAFYQLQPTLEELFIR